MRAHPTELYAAVAEVYVEALDDGGLAPNKDVAETWQVPLSTATRWVREARRRGLLAPTEPGVRGQRRCSGRCTLCCRREADR
jgi:transposase